MHVYPLSFFFVMDFIGTLSMAFEPWAAGQRTRPDVGKLWTGAPTCVLAGAIDSEQEISFLLGNQAGVWNGDDIGFLGFLFTSPRSGISAATACLVMLLT